MIYNYICLQIINIKTNNSKKGNPFGMVLVGVW